MEITFSKADEQDTIPAAIRLIHIRHATSIIEMGERKFLVDPMLSNKESLPPVPLTGNKLRNPLSDLPFSLDTLIDEIDYLLLTHLHFDHFDKKAIERIPKTKTVLCSSEDSKKLKKMGFSKIQPIDETVEIDGIKIKRYSAIHGRGILTYLMGKGSSYLIDYNGFKLFLTGDSILTKRVKNTMIEVAPHLIIANAGAARFRFGKPITMSIKDVQAVSGILPNSKIVVIHLDTLNHCTESSDFCKTQIKDYQNLFIPADGEQIVVN
jgi:L-ascorbate metabolism protein UlaG (beta-lactamase superfamily)